MSAGPGELLLIWRALLNYTAEFWSRVFLPLPTYQNIDHVYDGSNSNCACYYSPIYDGEMFHGRQSTAGHSTHIHPHTTTAMDVRHDGYFFSDSSVQWLKINVIQVLLNRPASMANTARRLDRGVGCIWI